MAATAASGTTYAATGINGGRFDFDDGGTYCGGWEDGKAHGHGVCTGPKGQGEYSGSWHYGFEVSGVYTWPSGSFYEGHWQNGKRHGLGVESRGRWLYRGEWTQGFKGRYGVRQSTSTAAKYEGTWANGLQDGYGSETYADGGTYQGQWLRGMRHGYGVRTSAAFGVASHSKAIENRRASVSSLNPMNEEDTGHAAINGNGTARNGGEEVRGGFVLKSRSDEAPVRRRSLVERTGMKNLMQGLKIRRQRSTGDLDRKGVTASIRSTGSTSSWMSSESNYAGASVMSEGSQASFIVEDELLDPSVTETYMGEWKNDKRCGFGISERSDGLKYEGEWFNNRKYGYGITVFKDGTKEEGKYKNNILITSNKKKHLFLIRSAKFRERIDSAVNAAQRASKIALQKADIAISRTATARGKAEQADYAAVHAKEDSSDARSCAGTFAPDFQQPGVFTQQDADIKTDYRPNNIDVYNIEPVKPPDPPAIGLRASPKPPPAVNITPSDKAITTNHVAQSNAIKKPQVPNPSLDVRQNTAGPRKPSVSPIPPAPAPAPPQQRYVPSPQPPPPQPAYRQPEPAPQPAYRQPEPAPQPAYRQPEPAPQPAFRQPEPAPQPAYRQPEPASQPRQSDMRSRSGVIPPAQDHLDQSVPDTLQISEPARGRTPTRQERSKMMNAMQGNPLQANPPSGYALQGNGTGQAGGYNFQKIMDDRFEHYKRPPSRERSTDRFGSRAGSRQQLFRDMSTDRRPQSRQRTPMEQNFSEIKAENNLADSLNLDGAAPAATGNGMPANTFGASQFKLPDEDQIRFRGVQQEIPHFGAPPKRTESLYMKGPENQQQAPKTLNTAMQRKKSLPDVAALPTVTVKQGSQAMTREEISVLSSARREQLRMQYDESERYRANPILYIFNPQIREWFSRQQLMMVVLFVNVSLAIMFFKLLT